MSDPHLLLNHPFSLTLPHRLTSIPSWHEHIPFAFALVAAIQPRVLVELGTYRGDSYCAFCQVVEGLALPTSCYAVDTWQGDDHAGSYGKEVFEELRDYHDARYGRFSQLVRSTFDEARAYFDDGSVDLLHIDGLHTWEAVAHDFDSWKAKLSDRAIVLFHDINVRERDFGVWRLWKDLSERHPGFAFVHGHGLGVLAVGAEAPAEVLALCALPAEQQAEIRSRFAALGSRVGLMGQLELATGRLRDTEAHLASSAQGLAWRDQRIGALEKEAATVAGERARRDEEARRLETTAAELEERFRLAEEKGGAFEAAAAELRERLRRAEARASLLQDRVQASEGSLRGLQGELERLQGFVAESNRLIVEGTQLIVEGNRLTVEGTQLIVGNNRLRRLEHWIRNPNRIRRLVGWMGKKRRQRLERRQAQLAELESGQDEEEDPQPVSEPQSPPDSASQAQGETAPPSPPLPEAAVPVPAPVPAQASAVQAALAPATSEEAWAAYPRLKEEFLRRRATRHATVEVAPPEMVKAPADLEAFARGLELPAVTVPRVSIIVPVFNRLRDTLECIASVVLHTPSNSYELLVMDDGSTDQSATVLPLVKGLRYFRHETSLGFLVCSNRSAAMARGEFLVFLSNSARVTPVWLPPLVETFSSLERVGATGPKLLEPDGRLRAAAAVINPDLSVRPVGHGDDPRTARYNYPREVQCCPGACLVVPRRHFDAVGGFSEELRPAHADDCDLQLKLQELGLRTIYQPTSVVVYHPGGTSDEPGLLARNSQWMRERWGEVVDAMHAVRLIAFYLPQFHPFQENEFWWGKGFTEWTNVTKAQPCFAGHEQPHLPTDMGFYDLRVPEVMHDQARLARAYGISGFCYYYYWFHGKRLLETPLERLLDQPEAAIPFCLCWANENWTRRWDGGSGESEVLMGQEHSEEDDEAVIRDLLRFLRHPSYIRVNGKPMVLVYRVGLFPDVRRTAALWRDVCRREGLGEIHLVRADSFEDARRWVPPSAQGFDAAVEFPPHAAQVALVPPPQPLRPGFSGGVYDYQSEAVHAASVGEAAYLRYRTVIPRWDNTPRRQDSAVIFAGSSPGAYQAYLEELLRYTREQNVGDERILFVNAWNEWAEGAHLEADRRYGRAYLEATLAAVDEHLLVPGG